ncbi:MAG: phage tail protein [Peptococcaceae bacterium BICA1-7]|nr:MAG: phage tail protein [Peptococcaceae bacterium BICA1-7]HBV99390.1 phage tail protein [Desulfotomaculum sp.]
MDYFIGQIVLFPYSFTPMGWKKCDGTLLSIQQNTALFSLISNKFGGDGQTNFAVPNLIGAEPIPGMNYYMCLSGIYPTRD